MCKIVPQHRGKLLTLFCGLLMLGIPVLIMNLLLILDVTQVSYDVQVESVLQSCELTTAENVTFNMKAKNYTDLTTDEEVEKLTATGCWNVIQHYSFDVEIQKFREEERDYPIAFSILAHQNAQQLMILLSQIFAPQNVYCIHLDAKSPSSMFNALKNVQGCFPNVHLSSKREVVVYASFSRLQADINCMNDLLRTSVPWRHLINLSGQVSIQLLLFLRKNHSIFKIFKLK